MTIKRLIIFFCIAIASICITSCISKKSITKENTTTPLNDSDGDGVNDAEDICPDIKGPVALQGCPDRDGDGLADVNDHCPDVIGIARLKGCPIPDTDKDGINDEEDQCPTVFGYARYQGCAIPDTDGDGINDEEDKCINEPGIAANQGCPEINLHDVDTDADGVKDAEDSCVNVSGSARNHGCPESIKINKPKTKNSKGAKLQEARAVPAKAGNATNQNSEKAFEKIAAVTDEKEKTDLLADSIKTLIADTTQKSATLTFSFFKTIQQQANGKLAVNFIANATGEQAVTKNAAGEFEFIQKNDSLAICTISNIEYYKSFYLSLVYDTTDFEIAAIDKSAEQTLDFIEGNNWQWQLQTMAAKAHNTNITLQVNAATKEGFKYIIAQHKLNIKITDSKSGSEATKTGFKPGSWLGANFGYLMAGLASVFIIFMLVRRRKNEDKAK